MPLNSETHWGGIVHRHVSVFDPVANTILYHGFDSNNEVAVKIDVAINSDKLTYDLSLLGQSFELSVSHDSATDNYKLERDDLMREIIELSHRDPTASSIVTADMEVGADSNWGHSHLHSNVLESLGYPTTASLSREDTAKHLDLIVYNTLLAQWTSDSHKLCATINHPLMDWLFVNQNTCQ